MIIDEAYFSTYQKELAAAVRVHIARKGWKQKHLSEATGLTQARVSRILHDRSEWTLRDLIAIALALQVPVAELLPAERPQDEAPLSLSQRADPAPIPAW